MNEIYFDNSATTRVSPRAAAKAYECMTEGWGNPSSVHRKGSDAEKYLSESRTRLKGALGVKHPRSHALFFTGSGTEADNLAITGTLFSKSFRFRPRIVTTDSEHPAVLAPIREAEKKGFEVVTLSTKGGLLDLDEVEAALTPETVLLSLMRVNNETGAVYDVAKAFSLAKERCPEVVTHCDAIQGFLKLPCDAAKLGADLIAVSGHKVGAPKGVGALLCEGSLLTKKRLLPIVYGGGQEEGYRSGTENLPGIAAFGEAVAERKDTVAADTAYVASLREKLLSLLPDGVTVNAPRGEVLPHIISLQVKGIKSEVLVRSLSAEGIYLSAGSACSSHKLKTSPTLLAFGLTPPEADSTVRVSLGRDNTAEECEIFAQTLTKAISRLAKIR